MRKNFNNMPLHTLVIDFLRKKYRKLSIFFNLHVLYTEIFESQCFETWRLENMNSFALQKPPCFNTWRFLILRVLKLKVSKIYVFYTWKYFNLCVLKHGDWKIWIVLPYKTSMFQYMEIFESLCIEIRRFKNLLV